jgi:hypothetical protein
LRSSLSLHWCSPRRSPGHDHHRNTNHHLSLPEIYSYRDYFLLSLVYYSTVLRYLIGIYLYNLL